MQITNEEAIKIIKNYDVNGCGYCHQGGDEVEEAFQMAINALSEHLDTENNDNSAKINDKMQDSVTKVDLISREDVLNIIDAEEWEYIDYVTEEIGGNVDTHIRCYTENIRDRLSDLSTYSADQSYSWCDGCKEYDTEKHCCHRYSSFIRYSLQDNINAVLEDIKKTLQEMADDIGEDKGLECAIEVIEDYIEKMRGNTE